MNIRSHSVSAGAMRYPRLISKLYCSPIMILPAARAALEQALEAHLAGGGIMDRRQVTEGDDIPYRVQRVYQREGSLGIIRIDGIIDKHVSMFELDCYGGCDLDDVDAAVAQASADENVKHVLLLVNSPGGSATGTPETARRVRALAAQKPVTAFSDTVIGSAAYYIASQASEIVITESAEVGCVGTYMALLDATRAMEMEGLTVNLIKAGKFKAMGASFKTLEDAERAWFQAQIDQLNAGFVGAVQTARPAIPREALEGQTYIGAAALDVSLADSLALGLDEVLAAIAEPTR